MNTNTTDNKRAAVLTKSVKRTAEGLAIGVTFAFANKHAYTVELMQLDEAIMYEAACHGIAQKCGDATAISRNTETGLAATVADKEAAFKAVFDRLIAGQWNAPREGGGNEGGMLLRALVEYFAGKKTSDEVKTWLDEKTDVEKKALRANEKIAAIIARQAAAKVDASIDTDELLASF